MTTTMPSSLEAVRTVVQPDVLAAIDRLDPHTRLVAGYHFGFWAADGGPPTGNAGKGLRAALALLSARAVGATLARGGPAAVAVELVHNYSLLHDDVMDRDVQRHHQPTAWMVYGEPDAILAGDGLLGLAFEVLAEAPEPAAPLAVRTLGAAMRRLVAGQTEDLGFEQRTDVTLDECLAMVGGKTAALLACSCSLGAVLCAGPGRVQAALGRFGEHLGVAFQLVDDLLGIWGRPELTGKPVLSDLASRKKSIPVVYALTSGTAAGERLRELYFAPEPLDGERRALAAKLVEEAGGRDWTEREADRRLELALAALPAEVPADVRAELVDLAHFVTGRDY
jgi:geranylgeranyl diphosphate synthase type I